MAITDDILERAEKMRKAFCELEEGVDYEKVPTDINSPFDVFEIEPISEKGRNFFKGRY